MWKGLPGFRGEATFRTWAHRSGSRARGFRTDRGSPDTLGAVKSLDPLQDEKLNALRDSTRKITDEEDWVKDE